VEHLELVALGAEPEFARPVGDDPDQALVVRGEGGVGARSLRLLREQ
jgi:hypothetical protein